MNITLSGVKNRRLSWVFIVLATAILSPKASRAKDAVDYIDPFIGCGHFGKDFPGATTPFSMVKVSPDDGGSISYHYADKTLEGFSFSHLGGADGGELGNLLTMATTGPLHTYAGKRSGAGFLSSYSKATEKASAGYYAVTLDDYKIRAEATAADHSGMLRFTFPESAQSRIQIDLSHRNGGTSMHQTVKVVDDHTIEGRIDYTSGGGGWHCTYTAYYYAQFSKPFSEYGVWSATLPPEWQKPHFRMNKKDNTSSAAFIAACKSAQVMPGCKEAEGSHLGFYSEFPTHAGETVTVKAGISFVSIDGAKGNLSAEIPDWDFDKVHQNARDAWAHSINRLAVEGGSEDDKTIFYSALYRALQFPQIDQDVDGDYSGGDGKPHHAEGFTNRTIFSGWDVYRSEYPLLTLIDPTVVNDQINSMVSLAQSNGTHYYDRWEIMGYYSGIMIGNPEVVVINDAYQKGIRNFDVEKAYDDSVNSMNRYGNFPTGYCPGNISETTEYTLDDWNMAQLAAALGKKDDAAKYQQRSTVYKELFDPNQAWTYDAAGTDANPQWKGWFRAKDAKGNFVPWTGLLEEKTTREATVYQAGWSAYNDIPGMIALNGGKELFVQKLNDFFTRTPDFATWSPYSGTKNPYHQKGQEPWWNPYNNPVNEPTELIPFLFNRAGAPWLTQKWVRQSQKVYLTGPEGMPGDDDTGQMSAWYVLASIGLHQSCPGDPRFEVFTPMFDRVTIRLDPKYTKGGTFTITTTNNSPANIYIQSATLNGRVFNRCWLDYSEIAAGGALNLVLGPHPNETWGIQ
jgi:predicted alpha-1,2-mannosidase